MDVEAILKDLRKEYIAALPQTIEKVKALIEQGQTELVREEFHKLKGTGKTYGIDELSIIGKAIEDLCVFHPQHTEELLPLGPKILADILAERLSEKRFDIEKNQDFKKLQKLVGRG